jgi:hypothetical protein
VTIAEVTCRSPPARVGKKRRMADGRRFIGVGDRGRLTRTDKSEINESDNEMTNNAELKH